jgi:hypothetical protein
MAGRSERSAARAMRHEERMRRAVGGAATAVLTAVMPPRVGLDELASVIGCEPAAA